MKHSKALAWISAALFFLYMALGITACVSSRRTYPEISRTIYDRGIKSASQLTAFFISNNPEADKRHIKQFAQMYIDECRAEGINSDCAFVQMCHETGFLKFGNLVTPEMHNYCGLGAIDQEHRGEVFETEQLGIRAHVQHLHAYATTEEIVLNNECIDRRYKYVNPRGKSPDISGLSGTWAADPLYSVKLEQMIQRLERF